MQMAFPGIFFISINRLWNFSNSSSTDSVSHSIFIFFANALSSMTAIFQETGDNGALVKDPEDLKMCIA